MGLWVLSWQDVHLVQTVINLIIKITVIIVITSTIRSWWDVHFVEIVFMIADHGHHSSP